MTLMTADYQEYLQTIGFLVTLVLTLLSLTAYRSTRETRVLVVSAAFALWTIRLGLGVYSTLVVPALEGANWIETTSTLLDTATPLLFFFAIVKKDARETRD